MRTKVARNLAGVGLLGFVFYGINAVICSSMLDSGCTSQRLGGFVRYTFLCIVVTMICFGVSMITQEEMQDG
ncbi:MAG: hypothetical protein UZ21_OP11001001176 [Microgenomates bacterium OLB22]|nr:MAG: hypothetical protein UZ21_OP11001001176 [Microgenomates bacterium OLB22]